MKKNAHVLALSLQLPLFRMPMVQLLFIESNNWKASEVYAAQKQVDQVK